jgi:hypothetical protein
MRNAIHKRYNLVSIVAMLMVVLTLFSGIGFIVVYQVKKIVWYQQQREAKEGENVVVLHLTKAEFKSALVDEHELLIQGDWYDIRSVKHDDGHMIVTAVHDEHEKSLLSSLTDALVDDGESKSSAFQQWLKVLQTPALATKVFEFRFHLRPAILIYQVAAIYERTHSGSLLKPPCVACA